MDGLNYFLLRVDGGETGPLLAYYSHKHQVFLSPHTKAVSMDLAAHLESLEVATRAAKSLGPIARKRYGDAARIEVVPIRERGGGDSSTKRTLARIKADTAMMEARIAQGVFAPNKRPSMP
jgi:hypothetical protein